MDTAHRFWKDYYEADFLEKEAKLEKPVKMFDELKSIEDDKLRLHSITTMLRSYIDDLIEYMETKEKKAND